VAAAANSSSQLRDGFDSSNASDPSDRKGGSRTEAASDAPLKTGAKSGAMFFPVFRISRSGSPLPPGGERRPASCGVRAVEKCSSNEPRTSVDSKLWPPIRWRAVQRPHSRGSFDSAGSLMYLSDPPPEQAGSEAGLRERPDSVAAAAGAAGIPA